MRKLNNLIITAFMLAFGIAGAAPVNQNTAEKVAADFYIQTFQTPVTSITLSYAEKDASGLEVYYAFDINDNSGFVLVSAEDAGRPIIGYSNTGHYIVPTVAGENINFWMQKRQAEIISMRTQKLTATVDIKEEWDAYINNIAYHPKNYKSHKPLGSSFPSATAYLVQSTWDQQYPPYPYNYFCPPGLTGSTASTQSVTGCCATAMAQIMRYWSYPAKGTGSSSYSAATYGTLSANYAHPYNWSAMVLSPSSTTTPDTNTARLMYDAGVSVQMDYSPSGSGAYVITADDPTACAQISYVKYFGYSSTILDGLTYSDYQANPTNWQDTLETELNHSRPVQYVGYTSSGEGHTWVSDGYNSSNDFHMNWGWSAQDDGWFALNDLNPGGASGYDFSEGFEALIGIMPPGLLAAFTSNTTSGCTGMTVKFTDQTTGQGTPTAWSWSFPGGTPSSSTLQNPTVKYNTSGTYNVIEVVTDNTGKKDTLVKTAYITVQPGTANALPLVEDFQASVFAPTGWAINNPSGHATTWALSKTCGGFGKSSQCMYYNNCTGGITGNYDQIYTPAYNFSSVTSPELYFDVAYEPYGVISGVDYTDTLAVYYSTDCGNTWKNVYLKGGTTLCTTGGTAGGGTDTLHGGGCFLPGSTHWRTDTIKIPAIAGNADVMFSFENRSGNGTNLYVDNVNIPGVPLSIFNLSTYEKITVYPNPNNGSITIQSTGGNGQLSVEIYNVLGQNIYNAPLSESKTQISFTQTAGVYFYRILSIDGKMLSEGKLVVK
ncbi:MAG: C10 family peptidase [Bacteroidia bacterium]